MQQDQRNVQASLPQREAALDDAEGRLGVLVRAYPQAVEARLARPLTPQLVFDEVPAGLPADLLGQRPDVAAAWARLEAARARVGARKAERFPSITLSAQPGTQGGDIGGALDVANNWAVNLAAGLTAPIFQGGRLQAQLDGATAQRDQAAWAYRSTVLGAFREVEDRMAILANLGEQQTALEAQQSAVADALRHARNRYRAGYTPYIEQVDAQRALLGVELSLVQAKADELTTLVGLYQAVGGAPR